MKNLSLFFLCFFSSVMGADPKLTALLSSLDPLSVAEHLAFYDLYPETEEGKKSLAHAWNLLNQSQVPLKNRELTLPTFDIQAIISLITRQPFDAPVILNQEQLDATQTLGKNFANRKLKGYAIWTKKELLALPPEEVDLGRGLLINQFDEKREEIEQYEAGLDLMALQILARIPQAATTEEKIQEMNRFIFQEMRFRFPPHSIYAKDIDLYTFLPSVMDSREGVCLGVSILYLSLAQRIGIPLEIITPPGHIYVRYRDGVQVTNIETTARGIHTPSETYLGIDTRYLQQRNIKEVIGLAYMNQASVAWNQNDHAKVVELYERASPYLPDDPLLKLFLGLNYLFIGKKKEGKALLEPLKGYTFDHTVSAETLPEDYLKGRIDAEGIKTVFIPVDETRTSILEKQKKLEATLARYPRFRAGLLQLATTWLQLGRQSEALVALEKYHAIDPNHCIVEYYLASICLERHDYNLAWTYLKRTESLLQAREHKCRALRYLRDSLRRLSPEN
jgi:regulator of sirC expression with transglutaminase-like and TPR domain